MFSLIIKELPDFQKDLSDAQVLSAFTANHQVKNSVRKLFMLLLEEKNYQQSYEQIPDQLREIFYEDPSFYDLLVWYLKELSDYRSAIDDHLA